MTPLPLSQQSKCVACDAFGLGKSDTVSLLGESKWDLESHLTRSLQGSTERETRRARYLQSGHRVRFDAASKMDTMSVLVPPASRAKASISTLLLAETVPNTRPNVATSQHLASP